MAGVYFKIYCIFQSIFVIDVSGGGICYTTPECGNDPSRFAADSGRTCCLHYDAVGFGDDRIIGYPGLPRPCQPCTDFLENDAVICYTKSNRNLCWGEKSFKMVSPRACCEGNEHGGFSKIHYFSTISPQYGDLYQCTLCSALKPSDWSEWSAVSDCNVTCGLGVQRRTRDCLISPQVGICEGKDTDYQLCDRGPCTAPESEKLMNKWSDWMVVSVCNVTCGRGFRIRKRYCGKPEENYRCFGHDVDHEECFGTECPTDKLVLTLLIIVVVSCAIAIVAVILIRFYWKRRQRKFKRSRQNIELVDEGYVNQGLTSDYS